MDYKKHYNALITRAKHRQLEIYKEKHHIIPKCLGGDDSIENLVELTAREHFIAHLLLIKIYPSRYSLIKAVNMMCIESSNQDRSMNRMYGWLKEKFSKEMSRSQSGYNNSQYGSMWITNGTLSRKINKFDNIPENWYIGRVVNPNKPVKEKKTILYGLNSEQYKWIIEQEETIINEFKSHNSISKILNDRGFTGRAGNKILSNFLKEKGLKPLRRRNTKE